MYFLKLIKMKNLFYSMVVMTTILLSSCTPSTPVTPSTNNVVIGPQPKFQFKANGTLYICDALFDSRIGWYGNYYQQLQEGGGEVPAIHTYNGQNELSGGLETGPLNSSTYLNLQIPSATITVGSFTSNNMSIVDCSFEAFPTTGYWKSNSHTIVITRVSNSTADGTFTATLTSTVGSTTVNITEGTFSNIPVFN